METCLERYFLWKKYLLNFKYALEGKTSFTISNANPIPLLWKYTTCFSLLPFIKNNIFSKVSNIKGTFLFCFRGQHASHLHWYFVVFLSQSHLFYTIFKSILLNCSQKTVISIWIHYLLFDMLLFIPVENWNVLPNYIFASSF